MKLATFRSKLMAFGPCGYWRFNDSSFARLTDATGFGNHGSYRGQNAGITLQQSLTPGIVGAKFPGTDSDYAQLPNAIAFRTQIQSAMITFQDLGTPANGCLAYFMGSTSPGWRVTRASSGNGATLVVNTSAGTAQVLNFPGTPFDGNWHVLAWGFDSAKLYVSTDFSSWTTASYNVGDGPVPNAGSPFYVCGSQAAGVYGRAIISDLVLFPNILLNSQLSALSAALMSGNDSVEYTLLTSRQLTIADLFSITLADGTVLNWTSFDYDVKVGSTTYSSMGPRLRRGAIKWKRGVESSPLELRIASASTELATLGLTVAQAIPAGYFNGATATLSRVYNPARMPNGTFFVKLPYDQQVFALNPAGYWRMNERNGTSAADSSGNGRPLNIAGAVGQGQGGLLTGNPDTAMGFGTNGADLNGGSTSAFNSTGAVTLAAMINLSSLPVGTPGTIIANGGSTTDEQYILAVTTTGQLRYEHWSGIVQALLTAPGVVVPGTSYHIALRRAADGKTVTFFVNGAAISTQAATAPPSTSGNNFTIGALPGGTGWRFPGRIQAAAVWTSALNDQQVADLATVAQSSTSPPVMLFQGWIGKIEQERPYAKITVNSLFERLNLQWPFTMLQPACRWTLFDSGCALNQSSYAISGSAQGGSTRSQIAHLLTQPTGYFDQGRIKFTSGQNNGIWRVVQSAIASGASANYRQTILNDKPTGYWRFGDAIGSSTIADVSGNGNNGIVHGGITLGQPGALSGDVMTCALFDGSSGYVTIPIPKPATFAQGITFEFWFKLQSGAAPGQPLGIFDTFPADPFTLRNYNQGGGSPAFEWKAKGQPLLVFNQPAAGTWVHIAVVYRGQNAIDLYYNGQLYSSATAQGGGQIAWKNPITIGNVNGGANGWFKGYLQELAIYGYAMSADQPLAHYDAGTTAPSTNGNGMFILAQPLPYTPAVADSFVVYPGCDKSQRTCQLKFNNVTNFAGFPYVPAPETAA